jgi:hypothetical protein
MLANLKEATPVVFVTWMIHQFRQRRRVTTHIRTLSSTRARRYAPQALPARLMLEGDAW